MVVKYGFPLVSKKTARKIADLRYPTSANKKTRENVWLNDDSKFKLAYKWRFLVNEKFDTTNKCCHILKHEPLHRFEKEYKLKPFVGIYAENSQMRKDSGINHGCNIYTKSKEVSRPMMIWTKQDVWDYIKINNLSYSEIYDDKILPDGTIIKGEKNTGCMYCGFGYDLEVKSGEDRFERNKLRRPKQYKNYMKLMNGGVTFRDALDKVKCVANIRKENAPTISKNNSNSVFHREKGFNPLLLMTAEKSFMNI